ncbi:receptor-like serine/threonine-protein kinase NCRK [Aristolochia californica]|uniref:receptor-like serine/threonine-protein kinase NCRK n=1 Tax=Aristolochia californica TaxID=171875 RepID=UPI0035DFD5C6
MRFWLGIITVCIVWLHHLECISCDVIADGSGPSGIEWTCLCASSNSEAHTPEPNCSTACDCRPEEAVGGSNGKKWACLCAGENVPTASSSVTNPGCFTACNCTSGASSGPQSSSKHISSKVVVYVLLLCVVLTTVAFLASIGCYLYRKDRSSLQQPVFSSDKDTSWNSATKLISQRSGSVPEFHVKISSCFPPMSGCLRASGKNIPGSIIQFSYCELEKATNKFSNDYLVGFGGSSNVYRGQLRDGRAVAVKRLKMQGGPDAEFEFLTEIELLSRLHHCHIVPIIGYCSESQGKHFERLLVFEYMSNGNLRDCLDGLQGKQPLEWTTRVNIALGAARGLEYLHEAAAPRILHRDIKSTNILLDQMWRARITDLGMAKRLLADDVPSCSNSPARMLGTFGYFAPEYAIVGKASLKSDVFSFGVVLLELVSGRPPIHKSSNKGPESLVIWANPRLLDSKRVISELADPLLKGQFPEEEMQIMAYLARECLQLDPENRPTMSEVVQILSTIAPDKSKRRNFSAHILQSSSSGSMKYVEDVAKLPEQQGISDSANREEPKPCITDQCSRRSSLPLSVDRKLCLQGAEGDKVLPSECIERLMLLTSRARSWRGQDEENVDLVEPRLESFWQANIQSL